MFEENNTELNQTAIKDVPVPQPQAVYGAPPPNKCSHCGVALTEEQIFCPHCGQKNDSLVSAEMPDAIAMYNQGIVTKANKKKKKTKILIILLAVFGVIAAAVIGVYVFFNVQVEEIIDEINSSTPSSVVVESSYEALTPIGQFLFRGKIVDAFVDGVSDNAYPSSTSLDYLVDEDALDRYESYKEIGEALNITSDDGTNVMQHIEMVLSLEAYEQYNAIRKCVVNSVESYADCMEYIEEATGYYSSSLVKTYVGLAHSSAELALSSAKTYSSGDTLCTQYVAALSVIEEDLEDLYYGYYSSSSNFSSATNTISEIFSEVTEVEDTVEGIVESIPEIY